MSAALDLIQSFDNSSSLNLNGKKTEGSSVGSVVGNKRNSSPKRILNGEKIQLNSGLATRLDLNSPVPELSLFSSPIYSS